MPKRQPASLAHPCTFCEGDYGVNDIDECNLCGFKEPRSEHAEPLKRARRVKRTRRAKRTRRVKSVEPKKLVTVDLPRGTGPNGNCVITTRPRLDTFDEITLFLEEQGIYILRDGVYILRCWEFAVNMSGTSTLL